ncbi:hypothetical protein ACLI1A_03140 [Flavobacterium sp. RHBU_3]|uniref:hypothetical protein n=1 Tax=Flavobacterium sp. RHBU_3 TaxID=3391184 RepID=UPI0039848EC1
MKYFAMNSSSGFAYLRTGGAVTTTLSANGILGLGICGLLFSVWSYYEFVRSKKKRLEDLEIDREDESKIQKRKIREAYLRRFGGKSHR